ncbi:MAG: carbamoyltransferase HypF [Methanomassiliicoccaceae archaeon]|nr:carbamoyltransferase HypF [Methanomassiliicoccaceae archaeon]
MRIVIKGVVQGVGFRPTVHRIATSLGLNGCVWNDGPDVVIDVDDGNSLLRSLYSDLPPLSSAEKVITEDSVYTGDNGFFILPSRSYGTGVGIPADTTVCEKCIIDMRSGRRERYPFTTCTECGARFTLMFSTPYDRENTSMFEYRICEECSREYDSSKDRRFHHQTICCRRCGPGYSLYDNKNNMIDGDPIAEFGKIIDSHGIGIIKGIGGMHICSLISNANKVREQYGRPQKPFAVMVKDINSVFRYAEPSEHELSELTSRYRPIVLMKKKNHVNDNISPGLDSIGIFLPYAGVHHILFDSMRSDAVIMTSANIPGEPMITANRKVTEMNADAYLLHDQKIMNRADDTVLRMHGNERKFIRRSRGFTPSHITTEYKGNVVALGAQENIAASVACNNRIHQTQHIGDHGSEGVAEYLEDTVRSLMRMLGCTPDAVAIDLHPGYGNRRFAKILCAETGSELIEVQHHWAHCASLLAENKKEEGVILALDGTGYGSDGNAWGGEVIHADAENYERLAHLQYIPLLGSEKALYDLRRLKFAVDHINGVNSKLFDDETAGVLNKMISKSVRTSSFGRLLDTLAFSLNVCSSRTYDGEPAMKMESLLSRGKMIKGYGSEIVGKEIMTAPLFTMFSGKEKREDVAYSVIRSVVDKMVEAACDAAESNSLKEIGVTGGVSYNLPICRMIREEAAERNMSVIMHTKVPNGDGGISVGQAIVALRRLNG